jgi:hypothetical protein
VPEGEAIDRDAARPGNFVCRGEKAVLFVDQELRRHVAVGEHDVDVDEVVLRLLALASRLRERDELKVVVFTRMVLRSDSA